jgi:DeoR family fructose operon transcriptional repressor
MFAEERYRLILQAVNQNGKATVMELSEALGVTAVTVRRDLEKLEERGLLLRTHGGALVITMEGTDAAYERTFQEKLGKFAEEKGRIAQTASDLVVDGEAILLTPGTTNTLLYRKLVGKNDLTIVTNAANIVLQESDAPHHDVILTGGKLRAKSFALVGPLAEQSLNAIRVDKLFLGVDGFDLYEGLTTPNLLEASINRKMIEISKQVIVVADHSKFGRVFFSKITSLDVVHTVISDRGLPERMAAAIRDVGIKLLLV